MQGNLNMTAVQSRAAHISNGGTMCWLACMLSDEDSAQPRKGLPACDLVDELGQSFANLLGFAVFLSTMYS